MDARVVAVATNPAIDRVARLEGAPRGVARAAELLETPGGKAIHVACVAAELGAAATVITTAGGHNGRLLLELLASEPVEVESVPVAGATRGTYTLVDAAGGDLVEVHEPGGGLSEADCDALVRAVEALDPAPAVIGVCGSLPAGARTDLHARLVAAARGSGAFVILDSSSPEALAVALPAGPDLVAPNLTEATAVLGGAADSDPVRVAEAIRDRGAAAAWLSLSDDGSVFADADGSLRATAPPPERIVNAVGCGDALIGGFAAALAAGREPRAALALGTAAATDKLSHLHPGRVERARVEALAGSVEIAPARSEARV
jgi:1-phosphofructokinase family hexose kinase